MSDITLNIVFDRGSRNTPGKKENKSEGLLKKKPFPKPKGMLMAKKKKRTKKRKKTTHVWSNGATHHQPDETSLPSSSASASSQSSSSSFTASSQAIKPIKVSPACKPFKYLAIDCEMVGTGPKGCRSELARCSIVSYNGDVIYDKFIKPTNPVTDFRTRWSGIRPKDLRHAIPFLQAQKEILKIVAGKVVIGHAISNDFKALKFSRPASQTRDTSQIPLLNRKAGLPETGMVSLKRLTKALFNKDIQSGRSGHSSVEDAQATMELYKLVEIEWEAKLASQSTN